MRRPPPDPDRHHRSGVANYERGNLKGALRDYSRALKLDPLRADILNVRAPEVSPPVARPLLSWNAQDWQKR